VISWIGFIRRQHLQNSFIYMSTVPLFVAEACTLGQVGDNVGDCAARGADLFESIAAEIISAMILGGSMAKRCKLEGQFPYRVVCRC
jgi:hypothetical protein